MDCGDSGRRSAVIGRWKRWEELLTVGVKQRERRTDGQQPAVTALTVWLCDKTLASREAQTR